MPAGRQLLAAACIVSVAAYPTAAKAPGEPGPTASASIRISVSVAGRYGLAKDGASAPQGVEQQGSGPYCLASTGGELPANVLLVYPPNAQEDRTAGTTTEKSVPLLPCGASDRTPDLAAMPLPAGQAVIVSPE